jgi:hypothetical protein
LLFGIATAYRNNPKWLVSDSGDPPFRLFPY